MFSSNDAHFIFSAPYFRPLSTTAFLGHVSVNRYLCSFFQKFCLSQVNLQLVVCYFPDSPLTKKSIYHPNALPNFRTFGIIALSKNPQIERLFATLQLGIFTLLKISASKCAHKSMKKTLKQSITKWVTSNIS